MPADYKAMYQELVRSVNEAVNILEHTGAAHAGLANRILREGLMAAEGIYTQTSGTETDA